MSNAIHILKQSIASLLSDKSELDGMIKKAEIGLIAKRNSLQDINTSIEELMIAIQKLEEPNVKSKNKKA